MSRKLQLEKPRLRLGNPSLPSERNVVEIRSPHSRGDASAGDTCSVDTSITIIKSAVESIRTVLLEVIQALAATVQMRDPYTADHLRKVAQLALAIAKELGLPEEQCEGLWLTALVHDLGKLSVPAEILSKPSGLRAEETLLIHEHPQVGYEILRKIEFPWPIADTVLQHHERVNGSGYPRGLSGEEIRLEARILGVADVVEAMSSHRPYRPAFDIDEALEEISQQKDVLYDPDVVEVCLGLFTAEAGFQFETTCCVRN